MLPGVQLLHCLVFDATGGDSISSTASPAQQELAATDPEAYELLTTTPLPFRPVAPTPTCSTGFR